MSITSGILPFLKNEFHVEPKLINMKNEKKVKSLRKFKLAVICFLGISLSLFLYPLASGSVVFSPAHAGFIGAILCGSIALYFLFKREPGL